MKASIYALVSIGTLAVACVGDDPVGAGGSSADGGGNVVDGSVVDPGATGAIEVFAEPVEVAHGSAGTIRIRVIRRGSKAPVTLRVVSSVPGVTSAESALVNPDETSTERTISFTTTLDTPTGATSDVVIVATASDSGEVRAPVPLVIRGVPGELDTSFGEGGTAASPLGGSLIADAVTTTDGSLFVVGNAPALSAAYDAEGKLKSDFGTGGVQQSQIPPGPNGDLGSFGLIRHNDDGTVSIAVRGYAEGTTYNFLRLDMPLVAPYAPRFTPQSKPATRLGNTCSKRQWVTPFEDGFRIVLDGDGGNCQGPPYASAMNAANEGIATFGTDGFGGTPLDPTDGNTAAVISVRFVSGTARVLTTHAQIGATYDEYRHALTSVDLTTAQTTRVQLGTSTVAKSKPRVDYYLSEPRADGQVLIIRSGATVPCLAAALPSGALDPAFAATCRAPNVEGDGRRAGGTYLTQGFAVVALGAESSLWTSADGTTLSAKVPLPTLVGGANAEIVHVFEAPNRRLLVITREPGINPWSIKRFWL